MTPAEKIADLREQLAIYASGRGDYDGMAAQAILRLPALLDIAEAAVARVDAEHSADCAKMDYHASPCTCGHDNLAAKLAALGGG